MKDELVFYDRLIKANPLGVPEDGRPRYGMTPEQATVYAYIVENMPHDRTFLMNFRQLAAGVSMQLANVRGAVADLYVRGWLEPDYTGPVTVYRLIAPVKRFKKPPQESLKRQNAHKVVA